MATIIVGGIAAYLGPAYAAGASGVALFAASMAAAYVDVRFILPKMMGKKEQPAIEDLQLQSTTAGSPKTISYGTRTRFGGQVLWLSDVYHESSSGGGGKSGEPTTLRYFVDISLGLCEREITKVDLIHIDGEQVYDSDPTYDESGESDQGTVQDPGRLNFWYTPQVETSSVVFVPFQEYAGAKAIFGKGVMETSRAELIVSSDSRALPVGSGVDFVNVQVGKSFQIEGGVWGIGANVSMIYKVVATSRGISPNVTVPGQSILRLDIKSATLDDSPTWTELRPINNATVDQSWARCLPNAQVTYQITAATSVNSTPTNMSITIGAGHGITVTHGRWLHFDVIWRNTLNGDDSQSPDQVRNARGGFIVNAPERGFGGGPFWAIAMSSTVMDLYEADKTTRIQLVRASWNLLVPPTFPVSSVTAFFVDDNASVFTYDFDQNISLGADPSVKWKPDLITEGSEEFFLGKTTETVKSVIVGSKVGEDNLPFRHRNAHLALPKMSIGHFGNRIPSLSVTVVREGGLTDSYGDAILDIAARCGLSTAQVTAEGDVATQELKGYMIQGLADGQRALQPLMIAGDIVSVESGDGTQGIIRFYKRLDAPALGIDMSKVGVKTTGQQPEGILNFREVSNRSLPKQVWVRYMDLENNLQDNVAGYMKADDMDVGTNIPRTSEEVQSINLPMSLSPNDAQGIAARLFQLSYLQRRVVTFTLGPKYLWVKENWRLRLAYKGEYIWVRVTRATLGVNMITEIEAVVENIMDI